MSGWLARILDSRTTQAVSLTARFAEARHAVLAENMANLDTPDFQARRLDAEDFRAALRSALKDAQSSRGAALILRGRQVTSDARGGLTVKPAREPAANALFHDGTNARLEDLVADVHENSLSYDLAMNLLRRRFDGLEQVIRGRTQ